MSILACYNYETRAVWAAVQYHETHKKTNGMTERVVYIIMWSMRIRYEQISTQLGTSSGLRMPKMPKFQRDLGNIRYVCIIILCP